MRPLALRDAGGEVKILKWSGPDQCTPMNRRSDDQSSSAAGPEADMVQISTLRNDLLGDIREKFGPLRT
jgi:hypothetical protein